MTTKKVISKKKKKQPPQAKHWVFTVNNPMEGDVPDEYGDESVFEYIVIGKEKGKDGTPHLQGYCVVRKQKRLTGMKKLFPRAHLEIARGTPKEASDYCKKDGLYVEYGNLPETAAEKSSERMTEIWESAWDLAKQGKIDEIPAWMRISYYGALKRIQKDYPQPVQDLDDVCGIWIHGKSGSGKSHTARAKYSPFYDKPLNKWWDGYQNEPNVILDDLNEKQAVWIGPLLKRWADRYSFPAEQKNTTIQIRPKRIIVTSQHMIHELFQGKEAVAIHRRFEQVYQRQDVDAFRDYYIRTRGLEAYEALGKPLKRNTPDTLEEDYTGDLELEP